MYIYYSFGPDEQLQLYLNKDIMISKSTTKLNLGCRRWYTHYMDSPYFSLYFGVENGYYTSWPLLMRMYSTSIYCIHQWPLTSENVLFFLIEYLLINPNRKVKLHRKPKIVQTEPREVPLPSISILKPLMGVDPNLQQNLETFFSMNYDTVCIFEMDVRLIGWWDLSMSNRWVLNTPNWWRGYTKLTYNLFSVLYLTVRAFVLHRT